MALVGNLTKKTINYSILEFTIIKNFKVKLHPPNAPKTIEVILFPLNKRWIKCNTDGSFSNSLASYGGIFRDDQKDFIYGFSNLVEGNSSFQAELIGVIHAIEITFHFGWKKLLLEKNSSLIILVIHDSKFVL